MSLSRSGSGLSTGAANAGHDYLPAHIAHRPVRGPSINHGADNLPDRFESFLLGPGEKKITSEVDTRTFNIPSSLYLSII